MPHLPAARPSRLLLAACAAMVATLSAAQGASAPAPVGPRVLFAAGALELQRGSERRALAVGEPLADGDALSTPPDARAQILMADGSRVALQPSTQVRLAASGAALEFMAGSVRVLPASATADFVLRTRRASPRVRGAAFSAAYNPDGTVNLASEREPVEVCTAGGCVTAADDNLRVRADGLPPTRTNARASWR